MRSKFELDEYRNTTRQCWFEIIRKEMIDKLTFAFYRIE